MNQGLGRLFRLLAILACSGRMVAAVVINEVMYHPPSDRDELQFIELHNTGPDAVKLGGWRFSKGVQCELPAASLPPGGLVVICRNPAAFVKRYGTNVPVLGAFDGRLKHGGERLELKRPDGTVADAVEFDDHSPWPTGPDGYGASLERRSPLVAGDDPANWGGSTLPNRREAAGTPGQTNSNFSNRPLPMVSDVQFTTVVPGKPVTVTAKAGSPDGIQTMTLNWRSTRDRTADSEQSVKMSLTSGSTTNGVWEAAIPPQSAGRLLRFRVRATAETGSLRWFPDDHDPRPTLSAYVISNTNQTGVAQVRLLSFGTRESPGGSFRNSSRGRNATPGQGAAAFVALPTNGGPVQTFDYIRITPRQDGWKVRLHKDQPYAGITTLNVVNGGRPRWLLSEALSYELFRRSGVPTPLSGHVRAWFDDRPVGYCIYVEQPNSSFLKRTGRDSDGNLYKVLWYEQGLIAQHEKKNNPASGHADLLAVVNGLKSRRGTGQGEFIQNQFNVEECASYFAVGQCIQNWDGCFNNHFVWHAPGANGRWEIIPWDLDKTWGEFDGASDDYDWYTLPLTYGMNGAKEPSTRWFAQNRGPWGSAEWWRPPGWFSGPLLAEAGFRQRFLQRVAELCRTEFTEERFGPVIADLKARLEPEVRWQATQGDGNADAAVAEFRRDIESFQRQLKERRAFLLSELKKAGVAKP